MRVGWCDHMQVGLYLYLRMHMAGEGEGIQGKIDGFLKPKKYL